MSNIMFELTKGGDNFDVIRELVPYFGARKSYGFASQVSISGSDKKIIYRITCVVGMGNRAESEVPVKLCW